MPLPEDDAALALRLLAVDPIGLGGAVLRCGAGPAREAWLAAFKAALPATAAWRRAPLGVGDERLLGGLDLAATLQAGRPVAQAGLLAQADGGVLLLPMAERLSSGTVARVCAALDSGQVKAQRDGLGLHSAARFATLALDEGVEEENERVAPALADRLAFALALPLKWAPSPAAADAGWAARLAAARAALPQVKAHAPTIEALCQACEALGIASSRAAWLAWRATCAAAAWRGAQEVNAEDAALAARLVLAHRATRLPQAEQEPQDPEEAPPPEQVPPPPDEAAAGDETPPPENKLPDEALDDVLLSAALAALPPGLLAALKVGLARRAPRAVAGKAGAAQAGGARGRPLAARPGWPRAGQRLSVIDTLRAAAPWQRLRAAQAAQAAQSVQSVQSVQSAPSMQSVQLVQSMPSIQAAQQAKADVAAPPGALHATKKLHIRREDFHVRRHQQKTQTTTLFVVDASGSQALHRLAEAKGAVELLLADCYVRRDQVALLAFRGQTAELLLPPTRSLLRAKRALAGLPGGGGTPLALALDQVQALAEALRRRGQTPVVVLLTDGRANIARDGSPGRERAAADALQSAKALGARGHHILFLDTATQAQTQARALAQAMAAHYLPLPHADAKTVHRAVALASA